MHVTVSNKVSMSWKCSAIQGPEIQNLCPLTNKQNLPRIVPSHDSIRKLEAPLAHVTSVTQYPDHSPLLVPSHSNSEMVGFKTLHGVINTAKTCKTCNKAPLKLFGVGVDLWTWAKSWESRGSLSRFGRLVCLALFAKFATS